jgi:hypothetical protein
MVQTECSDCTEDFEWYAEFCIAGDVYGYCEYNGCGGACEYWGQCGCECHG